MTKGWYILRVASGFETEVRDRLSGFGVESYVPFGVRFRHCRRQRKTISSDFPLIPGYVFVSTEEPVLLKGRLGPYSRGFLRNGDRSYAVLSVSAHQQLIGAEFRSRSSAASEWKKSLRKARSPFGVGDAVFVPSMGLTGKISRVDSSSYAITINNITVRVSIKESVNSLELLAA